MYSSRRVGSFTVRDTGSVLERRTPPKTLRDLRNPQYPCPLRNPCSITPGHFEVRVDTLRGFPVVVGVGGRRRGRLGPLTLLVGAPRLGPPRPVTHVRPRPTRETAGAPPAGPRRRPLPVPGGRPSPPRLRRRRRRPSPPGRQRLTPLPSLPVPCRPFGPCVPLTPTLQ